MWLMTEYVLRIRSLDPFNDHLQRFETGKVCFGDTLEILFETGILWRWLRRISREVASCYLVNLSMSCLQDGNIVLLLYIMYEFQHVVEEKSVK